MFTELLAKTNYSFLQGASFPEQVVETAKELGYKAIGIVDTNGVYGIARAHVAAKKHQIKLLIGAEIPLTISPTNKPISAYTLVQNRAGYGDLCELLTLLHNQVLHNKNGDRTLQLEALVEKSSDLILILPALHSSSEHIQALKPLFEGRLFLAVSDFMDGSRDHWFEKAISLSNTHELDIIATNQPLFHSPKQKHLQDVLTCINHSCTLNKGGFKLLPNAERHLKPLDKMNKLFEPSWMQNTLKVAELCHFSLDEIQYRYPNEWIPKGMSSTEYLETLVWKGARLKHPNSIPTKMASQLKRELQLIGELKYEDYFLTIWDIVQFAKSKDILCQGRGSAANSCVCFVLGITAIDPIRMDLLFERFISRERQEPPDIDIDFEHERREEVIQYIYERYGRHRAAITAEVICYRRKSAFREVAKVFEIPNDHVTVLQTLTHRRKMDEIEFSEIATALPTIEPKKLKLYIETVRQIQGVPRHLGTHVGGFVLCQDPLNRNIPIEKAAMPNRTIVQWDKNDLDNLGFVRVDILGLGILTCLRKCFDIIRSQYGKQLSLATIPGEDPRVYQMLQQADTVGVFQIESRAQMNMLPRLRPENFFDLVIEVSLIRPGPIQGDMVHPYLRRRQGKEKAVYPHPDLRAILGKTHGVPIFQEQIMKIAMVVAGFSGGEADALRRAMGTWRRDGKGQLTKMGERFREGLIKNGIPEDFAHKIFSQIEGFAEYGFPESHAASFSIIAYASAYLKLYYPDAFLTAILNSQPMGFYAPHTLIEDAKRHGVAILPISINDSNWDNYLEGNNLMRLGFRQIRGMKKDLAHAIETTRMNASFKSLKDFVDKIQPKHALTKRDLFLIAAANGFDCLQLDRRQAFWEIQALSLKDSEFFAPPEGHTLLPKEKKWETISSDFNSQGVSLFCHPMAFLRDSLPTVTPNHRLPKFPARKRVEVAGIVICRQMPPSASGVLFITLEDEFGFANLVIWNQVYQRYKSVLVSASFLRCKGEVQRAQDGNVTHIIVDQVTALFHPEKDLQKDSIHPGSYDFH